MLNIVFGNDPRLLLLQEHRHKPKPLSPERDKVKHMGLVAAFTISFQDLGFLEFYHDVREKLRKLKVIKNK